MAQKVLVSLVDDLDGSEAEETVHFGLDGARYEIDLSADNAGRLREELARFVSVARPAGQDDGAPARRRQASGHAKRQHAKKIRTVREWARENGWEISDRGRIPEEIMAAYDEAH